MCVDLSHIVDAAPVVEVVGVQISGSYGKKFVIFLVYIPEEYHFTALRYFELFSPVQYNNVWWIRCL